MCARMYGPQLKRENETINLEADTYPQEVGAEFTCRHFAISVIYNKPRALLVTQGITQTLQASIMLRVINPLKSYSLRMGIDNDSTFMRAT